MKKIIFLMALMLIVVAALSGCGTEEKRSESATGMNIALILDPASTADDAYNQQLEKALKKLGGQYKGRVTSELIKIPGSGIDRNAYIEEQIKTGKYNLVIDSDLYYTRSIVELAEKYPRQKFVLVDENIASPAKDSNILVIRFSPFQAGFVAGYAAAVEADKCVSIIYLKNNPNSRMMVEGFKKGILKSGKTLRVDVRSIEMPEYDMISVLMNGQRLRNQVYAATQQAAGENAEVLLVDELVPADAVLAALQGTNIKVITTGIVSEDQKTGKNFLGCVADNYEAGVEQAVSDILSKGFTGGRYEMSFKNDGMFLLFTDDVLGKKCGDLLKEIRTDSHYFDKLEEKQ